MPGRPEENWFKVVKIAQELLLEHPDKATLATLIPETLERVLNMNPAWRVGFNHGTASAELMRRFSFWIGEDATLQSEEGHVAWLVSARKADWRYWQRYRDWQERTLSYKAVEALDQSTDKVLSLLEDPKRDGAWDRRGLVVGHVQSGKTSHYTGLISKAADAGYKIIIVLAGLHNNLRSQTQMRLDEGFLGYETQPTDGPLKLIGVGEMDGDPSIRPNFATNRSEQGDFGTKVARNLGITPEQRPWLFVVKKNKTVLSRLLKWVADHVADKQDPASGRKVVTTLPLLLIDDEADHASVDTGERVVDDEGNPDEEHEPTAINRRIRKLLHSFTRKAYVGYTATPFANIFIHERGATNEEGPDLFPSAFIHNLAAPSTYVGPATLFGNGANAAPSLPLVRRIEDFATIDGNGWMPQNHKNGHVPRYEGRDEVPPSLQVAVHTFILACAVRRCRGEGSKHSSMLVHVSRFTSVQAEVRRQVEDLVAHIKQRLTRRIGHEPILAALETLWTADFVPTAAACARQVDAELAPGQLPSWPEVDAVLSDVVSDIAVRNINGTAKDALDYVENRDTGLKVIAIGGDKLARGLTLEGLCVSYFLRASKMYDTLMQMGRWFGYRPGYLDLCRLFTTEDLTSWFGHIAEASEELREEFDLMAQMGATPREYGLKVQSHPVLMVTSRLKMRASKNLMLSFSGHLLETVALHRDPAVLEQNLAATRNFIAGLGVPETNPVRQRGLGEHRWEGFLWDGGNGAGADAVATFLETYRTHPDAHKVNSVLAAQFVRSMAAHGELTTWDVIVIGGGEGKDISLRSDVSVDMLKRAAEPSSANRYSIGRLMSPRDEAIDLDAAAWAAALALTRSKARHKPEPPDAPNGPAIRQVRGLGAEGVQPHPERGVLFLYVIDPALSGLGLHPATPGVVAMALSFPSSTSGDKVEYRVNNVLWELEYGGAD